MKVRVYTDYDPIKILRGVSKKEFTEPTDDLALKCGLSGNFVEVDDSELPKDRSNRNFWKVDGKKISVDAQKVAQKEEELSQKKSKKDAVLAKLKITESEFAELLK